MFLTDILSVMEHPIEHTVGIYIGLLLLACVVGIASKQISHLPYTIFLVLVGLIALSGCEREETETPVSRRSQAETERLVVGFSQVGAESAWRTASGIKPWRSRSPRSPRARSTA